MNSGIRPAHRNTAIASIALAIAGAASLADLTEIWTATHGFGPSVIPADMCVNSIGAAFMVSHTGPTSGDIVLTKFDPSGGIAWESTYAGPGGQDIAVAVKLSNDESAVFAVGRAQMPVGGSDFVVRKFDASSGAPLWTRFHGGPAGSTDDPRAAAATPDGGLVVVGGTWHGGERLDFETVKFDTAGNTQWSRTFQDNGRFLFNDDVAEAVLVTPEGDVVVTGTANPGIGGTDIVTIKYDALTGATVWTSRFSTGANEAARRIAQAPDGSIVVLGEHPGGIDRSWVVARYDGESGAELWAEVFDPGFDESARSLVIDGQGHVFATGATDPDGDDGNFNQNLVVASFRAADGGLRWSTSIGGLRYNEADFGNDLVLLDGFLIVVGSTRTAGFVHRGADAFLLRMDSLDGTPLQTIAIDTSGFDDLTRDDSFGFLRLAPGGLLAGGSSTGDVGVTPRLLLSRFGGAVCSADFNADGTLDPDDLGDFINCFFDDACAASDYNGDGTTNADDLGDFINAYFAGC